MNKKRIIKIFGLLIFSYFAAVANYNYILADSDQLGSVFLLGFVDFIIISYMMMMFPFIMKLVEKKPFEYERGKKICMYNSIAMFILSLIFLIAYSNYAVVGGLGAVVYYYINMFVFSKDKDGAIVKYIKESKQKVFNKQAKKNKMGLYAVIGLVFIIGFSILVSNITGPEEAKLPVFKEISYAEYEKLFGDENKGLVFVYVGRPTCSFCVKIQPLLKTIEEEEKIVFNYLNTDKMTQEEIQTKISTTTPAFAGEWGTPTLLALIDGKEHSNVNGYRELEELRTFVRTAKSAIVNE